MFFYITIAIDSFKDKIKQHLWAYIIIYKLYCFINILGLGSVLLLSVFKPLKA